MTVAETEGVFSIGEAALEAKVSYFKLNRLIGMNKVVQPLRTQSGTRRFYTQKQIKQLKEQISALSARSS